MPCTPVAVRGGDLLWGVGVKLGIRVLSVLSRLGVQSGQLGPGTANICGVGGSLAGLPGLLPLHCVWGGVASVRGALMMHPAFGTLQQMDLVTAP